MSIRYKQATINDFKVERIPLSGGRNHPKIILSVETTDERSFEISEIFFEEDGIIKCQGLWYNLDSAVEIAKNSTLKHLLNRFDIESDLQELKGKKVKLRPNDKNYFTIDCSV